MRPATVALLLAAGCLAAGCQMDPAASGPTVSQTAPAKAAATSDASAPGAPDPATEKYLAQQHADVEAALAALPAPGSTKSAAAAPQPPAPHIYMALQPGSDAGPVSVIFAIDAAKDGTPSNDAAMRLTPEDGLCNPQEMAHYRFPKKDAAKPVFAETEQAEGVTAADLPRFLAAAVTQAMLARGLATTDEDTRPQNVCTRKLWERLVVAQNQAPPPAGGGKAAAGQ